MRQEAIAEILELTAPPPRQRESEFTIEEWRAWVLAERGEIVRPTAARDHLKNAVERGEFTTRMATARQGLVRVFEKIE